MKKLFTCFLIAPIAFLSLTGSAVAQRPIKMEPAVKLMKPTLNPPTQFEFKGKNPKNSEWGGEISSEEMQGIANSQTNWFVSNKGTIYKTQRNDIKKVVKKVKLSEIQGQLKGGHYNHFGDLDFHDGLLYVATTGEKPAPPIVIVFNENLEFEKYARFSDKQEGAGWVAIDPVTGYLYSSGPYRELFVYDRNFPKNSHDLTFIRKIFLNFKYGPTQEKEYAKIYNQGGAFSPHGIFYYVLDHKADENSLYTGVHAFLVQDGHANEITIKGKNNKNQDVNFMNEKYDPDIGKWRNWEFEGITVWDRGIEGQIHVLQLHKEPGSEDDVHLFHYKVNNDY